MSRRIRPLDDTLRLCGRARTGLYAWDDGVEPGVNHYELEIAIVDDLTMSRCLPAAAREENCTMGMPAPQRALSLCGASLPVCRLIRRLLRLATAPWGIPHFHGLSPLATDGASHPSAT
jgi:hypothetical protein